MFRFVLFVSKLSLYLHSQTTFIHKYKQNMENTVVNIRGSIKCLAVNEKVCLPKAMCLLSSVRTTAGTVAADTGRKFSVSAKDEHNIIVTRTA